MSRTEALLAGILALLRGGAGPFDMPAARAAAQAPGDFLAYTAAPSGPNLQVVPGNVMRAALLFGPVPVGTIRVWPKASVSVSEGFIIPASGYLEFVRSRHGSVVAAPWYAQSGAGAIPVLEIFR